VPRDSDPSRPPALPEASRGGCERRETRVRSTRFGGGLGDGYRSPGYLGMGAAIPAEFRTICAASAQEPATARLARLPGGNPRFSSAMTSVEPSHEPSSHHLGDALTLVREPFALQGYVYEEKYDDDTCSPSKMARALCW
jgi:hypothetical protein